MHVRYALTLVLLQWQSGAELSRGFLQRVYELAPSGHVLAHLAQGLLQVPSSPAWSDQVCVGGGLGLLDGDLSRGGRLVSGICVGATLT